MYKFSVLLQDNMRSITILTGLSLAERPGLEVLPILYFSLLSCFYSKR